MELVELTNVQFDEYAKFHPLNSYFQTSKYALAMSSNGYVYDYLGLKDESGKIQAAALILSKKLQGQIKYGYSPKGFLVNYYDAALLQEFLDKLRDYYSKKGYIFIKFNPEIIIGDTDRQRKYVMTYNGNVKIIDTLKNYNTKRRVEQQEFELMLPKYNAYLNLKNVDLSTINRAHRKRIRKSMNRGLILTVGESRNMDDFFKFIRYKTNKSISYYRNLYNIYSKDNSADLLFLKLDFEAYLTYVKNEYMKEEDNNEKLNLIIQNDPRKCNIARKILSDKKLQALKAEVVYATNGLKKNKYVIIAGAFIIKHANRVSIVASGYSNEYKRLNPNQYMYYQIIERYKNFFTFLDLNGISGNYEETSFYKGLNDFKLRFNPTVYEFIGEFDLICDERIFKKLIKTSFVEDEFLKYKY